MDGGKMGKTNIAKIVTCLSILMIFFVLLVGYTGIISALASPSSYTIKVTATTSDDPYARRHWLSVNSNKMDLGVVAGTASWEGTLSLSPGDVLQYWVDQPCSYATWNSKMYVNGNLVSSGPTCEGGGPIVLSYTIPTPPVQNPTLSSTSISPSNVLPGQSFTGYYVISNPNSVSVNVGLGLSIRRSGTYGEIVDTSNDVVISAAPGTNTYSRTFTVSSSTPAGSYDVAQAIWSGQPGSTTQYATSGWKSGALTISPPQQSLSISVSPTSKTIDSGSSASFSITVTDQNGNGVSGATIGIEDSAKGFSTSVTTNSYGSATYTTNPTSSGYVYFTATKSGYISSSKTSAYVTVNSPQKPTYLTLELKPSTVNKGDNVELWARLFDSSGSVVLGKTLKFYVSGNYIGSDSNSATGWVSKTYVANLNPGSYEVKVVFDGDSQYASSYKTQTLTVASPQPPSASIQSTTVDKSSYNTNETVKVSVSIKNIGNVDLSGLKINVDIADPNGNNVIANILQSGISLSAGQSYSTGYISYYTLPSNPVSGTYKTTVGLWNSDSSKNYDIEYQITSFSVSTTLEISQFEQLLNSAKKLGWNSIDVINTRDFSSTGKLSYQSMSIEKFKEPYIPVPGAEWKPVLLEIPDRNNPDKKRLVALVTSPNNILTQEYKKVKIEVITPTNYLPGEVFITLPPSDPLACTKIHYIKELKEWNEKLVEKATQEIALFAIEKIAEKAGVEIEPHAIIIESGLTIGDIISCVTEGPKVSIGQASSANFGSWVPIGQKIMIEANAVPTSTTMTLSNKWEGVVAEDSEIVRIEIQAKEMPSQQIPGPVTATYQPNAFPIEKTKQPTQASQPEQKSTPEQISKSIAGFKSMLAISAILVIFILRTRKRRPMECTKEK